MKGWEDYTMADIIAHQKRIKALKNKDNSLGDKDIAQEKQTPKKSKYRQ